DPPRSDNQGGTQQDEPNIGRSQTKPEDNISGGLTPEDPSGQSCTAHTKEQVSENASSPIRPLHWFRWAIAYYFGTRLTVVSIPKSRHRRWSPEKYGLLANCLPPVHRGPDRRGAGPVRKLSLTSCVSHSVKTRLHQEPGQSEPKSSLFLP